MPTRRSSAPASGASNLISPEIASTGAGARLRSSAEPASRDFAVGFEKIERERPFERRTVAARLDGRLGGPEIVGVLL